MACFAPLVNLIDPIHPEADAIITACVEAIGATAEGGATSWLTGGEVIRLHAALGAGEP